MHFLKQEQTNAALWDTISISWVLIPWRQNTASPKEHALSCTNEGDSLPPPGSTDSRKASYYHDCHSKLTDLSVHACQDLSSAAPKVWNVDHQLTQSRAKTAGLCLMLYILFQALMFPSSTGQECRSPLALISGGGKQALKYLHHSNFTFGMKCSVYFAPVLGNGLRNDASLWLKKKIPRTTHTAFV